MDFGSVFCSPWDTLVLHNIQILSRNSEKECSPAQILDVAKLCFGGFCNHIANVESNFSIFIPSQSNGCLPDYRVAWMGSQLIISRISNQKTKPMKTLNLIFASLIVLTALVSCKKETKTEEKTKTDSLASKKEVEQEFHKEWYGIYTGDFNSKPVQTEYGSEIAEYKKISVKINRITKDSVYGYSVVNGNQRPFRGIVNENTLGLILDEPGNDKSDGRFELKLKQDSLVGDWAAFDKSSVKSPEKTLKLTRKEFAYNPNFMLSKESSEDSEYENPVDWNGGKVKKNSYVNDEGKTETYENTFYRSASDNVFKINASKQKLTEKGLKNLRKLDLQIIRNTVFARHGYSFKKATYRQFFENTDWYVAVSNNVDADLTPLEKENVALLARLEKYAEDHYDTFGR